MIYTVTYHIKNKLSTLSCNDYFFLLSILFYTILYYFFVMDYTYHTIYTILHILHNMRITQKSFKF